MPAGAVPGRSWERIGAGAVWARDEPSTSAETDRWQNVSVSGLSPEPLSSVLLINVDQAEKPYQTASQKTTCRAPWMRQQAGVAIEHERAQRHPPDPGPLTFHEWVAATRSPAPISAHTVPGTTLACSGRTAASRRYLTH